MKSNPSTKEIQEALARLEKAKTERTNAQRRLSRAREAVDKASKEVSEGEEEFKAASTHLDQAVRRGIAVAMKKGGTDTSVKIAEIIAQSLGTAGVEDEDPAPAAKKPSSEAAAPNESPSGDAGPKDASDGQQPASEPASEPASSGKAEPDLLNDAA